MTTSIRNSPQFRQNRIVLLGIKNLIASALYCDERPVLYYSRECQRLILMQIKRGSALRWSGTASRKENY